MSEKSKSDEWWTLPIDFQEYMELSGVRPLIDYAATKENTKCAFYSSDSLNEDWKEDGFLNPPNSQLGSFILKAWIESKKNHIDVLCLVPVGVISRRYFAPIWKEYVYGVPQKIEIIPVPRPHFLYKGEKQKYSARNDYMLLVFRK